MSNTEPVLPKAQKADSQLTSAVTPYIEMMWVCRSQVFLSFSLSNPRKGSLNQNEPICRSLRWKRSSRTQSHPGPSWHSAMSSDRQVESLEPRPNVFPSRNRGFSRSS